MEELNTYLSSKGLDHLPLIQMILLQNKISSQLDYIGTKSRTRDMMITNQMVRA